MSKRNLGILVVSMMLERELLKVLLMPTDWESAKSKQTFNQESFIVKIVVMDGKREKDC